MRVLIVSTIFPFPQDCGKARVLGGLCRFLLQAPQVESLSYFQISRRPSDHQDKLPVRYFHAASPRMMEVALNLTRGLLRGQLPTLQEAMTYAAEARAALFRVIEQEKPDLVIADTIRAGQYLTGSDRPPGRYFLYLDDLFSLRYERILKVLEKFPGRAVDPLGNFAAFIPAALRPLTENRVSLRALLQYERRAVFAREIAMVRHFERCFLINPAEVSLLRDRSGADNVFQLKLLTDAAENQAAYVGSSPYFVFLGDLQLPHNHLSILNFVRDGAELLSRALPGYKVLIVGKSARPELVEACSRYPMFEVRGYVPDLHSVMNGARGMLAPLLFGSGVKIKTLDALRLGVPLVASSFGVEGLDLQPDDHYLHAETVESVIQQMARLIDPHEHSRLSSNGRTWFDSNYSSSLVRDEYEQALLS